MGARPAEEVLSRTHPLFVLDAYASVGYGEVDITEVQRASRQLRDYIIPQFVRRLDMLEFLPIDSSSLREAMHENGINGRFMGSSN